MVYDDADDHPGQWPSDFLGLKRIDQSLRCSICRGYFENTLMVDQCSHNYCSLCIRTHLSMNKDCCPSCNNKIEDKNLRSNRVVDEFLTHFKKIRSKLLRLVIGNNEDISSSKEEEEEDEFEPTQKNFHTKITAPKNSSTPLPATLSSSQARNTKHRLLDDSQSAKSSANRIAGEKQSTKLLENSKACEQRFQICLPLSDSTLVDENQTKDKNNEKANVTIIEDEDNKEEEKLIECPVCKKPVKFNRINIHLDGCFKQQNKRPPPSPQTTTAKVKDSTSSEKQKERRTIQADPIQKERPPIQASIDLIENGENKRKPLPKMALDSFSHQQLKAKAKSFGLQMKGSPKDLKERIKSYCLKYNAECDAKQPCGPKELVRRVENEEKEKALASKQDMKPDVLYKRVDRMKESEENNKLRREHSCNYDQQYNQLSDQAKRTKKERSKQMNANGPSKTAIQDKSTPTKHIESSPESPVQYKQDNKKPPDKRDIEIRQIDLTACDESSQSSQISKQKSNHNTAGKMKIFVGNERDETKKPNNSARNISKSINTKNIKKSNKSSSDIASFFRSSTSRKDSNAVREETPNNVKADVDLTKHSPISVVSNDTSHNVSINSQQENLSPTLIDSPEENSATQSPSMFEDFVATGGNQNHLVAKSYKQVLRQQNNTPSRKVVKQTARKTIVKNKSVCTTSKKRLRTDENDKLCHPMKRRQLLYNERTVDKNINKDSSKQSQEEENSHDVENLEDLQSLFCITEETNDSRDFQNSLFDSNQHSQSLVGMVTNDPQQNNQVGRNRSVTTSIDDINLSGVSDQVSRLVDDAIENPQKYGLSSETDRSETDGSETESDVDEGVGENLIPDPPSQFCFNL